MDCHYPINSIHIQGCIDETKPKCIMIKLKISSRCYHPKHLHETIKITSKYFMSETDLDYSIAIYNEKDILGFPFDAAIQ